MKPSKTVIITGAGSGLGAACVARFSQLGYRIAACDIHSISTSNNSLTHPHQAFQVDVTDSASITAMLNVVATWEQPIGVVINCAGIAAGERVVGREGAMPLANFKRVIDTNLMGTFDMIRLTAEVMLKQQVQDRVIINTASIAAYEGQIGQAAYAASKGGVVSMTLPLAREFKQFNIRVVTIAPGLMETPMISTMSEKVQANLAQHFEYPDRFGLPQEFAKLAAHVVENEYLNGCTLRLDGAVRLR